MTHNQTRALSLADAITSRKIQAAELADEQWQLLLLAAGLNSPFSLPLLVAYRVKKNFDERTGYFANRSRGEMASSLEPSPLLAVSSPADAPNLAASFS